MCVLPSERTLDSEKIDTRRSCCGDAGRRFQVMGLQSPLDAQTKGAGTVSMTERESDRKPARTFGPIISLQRVWKTYVKGAEEFIPGGSLSSLSSDGDDSASGYIPSIAFTPADSCQDLESEEEDNTQLEERTDTGSDGSPTRQSVPESHCPPSSSLLGVDSETESVVSDYSEMADPVKEHLANVHIVRCPDLDPTSLTQFVIREKVLRGMGEGEEEFVRRIRKTNCLSLAQEFAELKRQNENALPFNLHESRYRERKERESETDANEVISMDSCDAFNVSTSRDDSGLQNEIRDQPEAYTDNGNSFGVESKCSEERTALVDASGLIAFKLSGVVYFDEGCGCPGVEEVNSENEVLTPDATGKLMQPFLAENVPDGLPDQPSILHHGGSNIIDFSSFNVDEPEMISDRRDCSSTFDDGLRKLKMVEDLDDCTIENVFPQWDWKRLEKELMLANEAEHGKNLLPGSRGDRVEILQRLAMLDDEEEEEWYGRGGSEPSRSANPLSMGVCYVNEAADDPDPDNWGTFDSTRSDAVQLERSFEEADELNDCAPTDDLLAKQANLEAEARMALAQVRPMTQMQLKTNGQMHERSVTEMIGSTEEERMLSRHISQQTFERMTAAQLQVFANDLHAQIEVLNVDLMLCLVERDDLHMVQDSMLVDIEDLTGSCTERQLLSVPVST